MIRVWTSKMQMFVIELNPCSLGLSSSATGQVSAYSDWWINEGKIHQVFELNRRLNSPRRVFHFDS